MTIAGTHDRCTKQVLILVYHHQHIHYKCQEEHIAICSLGRREQVDASIST